MKRCVHCGEENHRKDRNPACSVCKNGLYRYNLNRKQQLALHESQEGKCALCEKSVKMFSGAEERSSCGYVDHSHATKKVRGILCHSCNTVLGYFENNGIDMHKVAKYIS